VVSSLLFGPLRKDVLMAQLPTKSSPGPHSLALFSRPGMSTTELLVSMGILAILVSVSLTVLSGARRSRAQAQCAANLRALGLAFNVYIQDYQDTFPLPTPASQWEDLLRPYTPRDTFRCAADSELFTALGSSYDWRDTGNDQTTLAGVPVLKVAHSDLSLAFDALPDWHRKNTIQVLRVGNSVDLVDTTTFFKDMQRSPSSP
jgi:type II secretory pathway pseudopilin PulG